MGLSVCSCTTLNLVFWFSLLHLTLSQFVASRPPLCHHDERSALLQFKESFFIDRSSDVSAYPSAYPKVSSWKAEEENGDCCSWDGITCNEDTGHVVSLNLTSSYLYGSINSNSSLFHLVHLEWLSLADNDFNDSKIPSRIMNLSRLTHLDLSYSLFSGPIPSEILELSNLVFLNVSHNQLEHQYWSDLLGSLARALTNLKMLDLSKVKISSSIPHTSLTNFSSLTYLSLEDCELQGEFPSEIFRLPNLRYLSMSENPHLTINLPEFEKNSPLEELRLARTRVIDGIPNSLGNLKSLSFSGCKFLGKLQVNSSSLNYLSLEDCELQGEFPSKIFCLPNLRYLSMSANPNLTINLPDFEKNSLLEELRLTRMRVIGGIPNSLDNLKSLSFSDCKFSGKLQVNSSSLTYLSLENCELQGEFPSEIFWLPNLRYLSVSANTNLTINLPEFEKNSPLEELRLAWTRVIGGIPNSLGNLKSLSYMDFSNCKFLGKLQVNSSSLTYLYLEDCELQGIFPSEIFLLPNLRYLDVSSNPNLTIYLPEFEKNSLLEELRLGSTQVIGRIPNSLGNLKSLSYLDISNSNLSGPIPSSIVNLTNISYLYLFDNEIWGELPSLIGNLGSLKELDLSFNKLTGPIPHSVINLNKLTTLSLSHNQLSGHIPLEIKNLTQLTHLDLRSNRLEGQVSSSLFELESLESLELGLNNLSGTLDINKFVFKLKYLEWLDLSSNNLSLLTEALVYNYSQNLVYIGLRSCNLNLFPNFLQKQDQLVYLDLSCNKIAGHIPGWLLNVSIDRLRYLNLSYNLLEGFDQRLIVLPWTSLGVLDLSSNKLQGPLPFPSSHTLSYLVSKNHLTGKLPRWICSLSYLQILDLSYNNLSGVLPQCLRYFTDQLSILKLQSNRFYGSIPEIYMNGSNLMMIDLSNNLFWGRIPRSLANCKKLEFLNLGNNQIDDIFPSWLGFLPELKILLLQWNRLYGAIKEPKTDFEFPKLHIIDLSHNRFKGNLPSKYFQCWNSMRVVNASQLGYMRHERQEFFSDLPEAFEYGFLDFSVALINKGILINYEKLPKFLSTINLSNNKFEGEIPASVGQLKGLYSLNVSNNNLQGQIPSSLGNLTALESLDLSHNRLSGKIPQQLAEITYLEVFDVSNNHLTGPIPEGKQFNTFDNTSYDGNPGLCGKPLSKKCDNSEPSQKEDEVSSSAFAFGWKKVAIGYASGLVIGLVLGHFFTERRHEWFAKTFGWQLKTTGRKTRNRRSM